MATEPPRFRPKAYPPPQFPPRRAPRFARMPPAVFPVALGALGTALALRKGLAVLGLGPGLADLLAGLAVAFWAFAVFAYGVKLARRPAVLWDDMKVLPGRAGLAAGSAGGLAAAALLVPIAPAAALWLLYAALTLHALVALATARALLSLPAEGRVVNPAWHLAFVGFIIGALAAAPLGLQGLAQALFWACLPIALAIWVISLWQIATRIPPAPLRPLQAIHLAPAALFATVAGLIGQGLLAQVFAWAALALALVLILCLRWIVASGFSALWGAFTFPLAALASALLGRGDTLEWLGLVALVTALGVVPAILWQVVRLWPGGQLAARTNAAEA